MSVYLTRGMYYIFLKYILSFTSSLSMTTEQTPSANEAQKEI